MCELDQLPLMKGADSMRQQSDQGDVFTSPILQCAECDCIYEKNGWKCPECGSDMYEVRVDDPMTTRFHKTHVSPALQALDSMRDLLESSDMDSIPGDKVIQISREILQLSSSIKSTIK
jgi:predicted RNA-binding protein with PUA domain